MKSVPSRHYSPYHLLHAKEYKRPVKRRAQHQRDLPPKRRPDRRRQKDSVDVKHMETLAAANRRSKKNGARADGPKHIGVAPKAETDG